MHGIKTPPQDFTLKIQGRLMREGGRICRTLQYKYVCMYVPYSLDIMPSLFISPPLPPLTFCMNLLLRYIYLQFMPPSDSATPRNERKVRTHCTTLLMKFSYLLASNTQTKLVVVRKLHCVSSSDCSHSAP